MDWTPVIEDEREFFRCIGDQLVDLQTDSANNMALEEIYAGVYEAYAKGTQALGQYEADLMEIQDAINTGQLNAHYAQIMRSQNIPQDRWAAALQILACLRAMHRPSQVFRAEMMRQSGAIIGKLQTLVRMPGYNAEDLTHDMYQMGLLLCSFDIPARDGKAKEADEGFLKGFMKPQVLVGAAVAAAGTYAVLEHTDWLRKRPKKKPKATPSPEPEPEVLEIEDEEEELPPLLTTVPDEDDELEEVA